MKKKIFVLLTGIFLFLLKDAYCQKKASDDFNGSNYENFATSQAMFLKDSLQLTSDQENAVQKVYSKLFQALVNLQADTTDFAERCASIKKLTTEEEAAFAQIFTDEQNEKYKAINNWRASLEHKK
jgi:uncharacterized protein YdiU (UPF0061 family)